VKKNIRLPGSVLISGFLRRIPRLGEYSMVSKKTPQQIWDQHKSGQPLDTGHKVIDGKGKDRDFVHADGESWERVWKKVRPLKDGI
jgi:hypothetical protein